MPDVASRPSRTPARWTLVLPLKGGPAAKSRLGGGPRLARAIAEDCLDAVLSCPDVVRTLVVTADPQTAAAARRAGAETVPESSPGSGLVAAVRDALGALDGAAPVGVLLADLPALQPDDLAKGLAAVREALRERPDAPMAAVPDAEGSGTVLLAGRTAHDLDPAFGPDSLTEHLRRGAVAVFPDLPRLRRDVDTPDDLCAALSLGAGPRTSALMAQLPSAC
jgi:2-phospho-L-lactate guanylyltransferase